MTFKDLILLTLPTSAMYSYPDKIYFKPKSGLEYIASYYIDNYKGDIYQTYYKVPLPKRMQDVFFKISQNTDTMEQFAYEMQIYLQNPSYYVKSRNI